MTPEERTEHAKHIFSDFLLPILEAKGHDYAGKIDANANFKIVANRLREGIDKYDVWAVYFQKHMTAIETWLKHREVKSEPIHMRIVDAINYLIILWCMGADDDVMPKIVEKYDGTSDVNLTKSSSDWDLVNPKCEKSTC